MMNVMGHEPPRDHPRVDRAPLRPCYTCQARRTHLARMPSVRAVRVIPTWLRAIRRRRAARGKALLLCGRAA